MHGDPRTAALPLLALPAIIGLLLACEPEPEPAAEIETPQPPPAAEAPAGAEPTPDVLYGVQEYVQAQGATEVPPFRYASTDLNRDGRPESVVLLQGGEWCRAGACTMLVFRGDDEGALLISRIPAVGEPIRVSPQQTAGWQDLIVRAPGGQDAVLRFDGTGYPSDLSRQPEAPPAQANAARPLALGEVVPSPESSGAGPP
ncbi:MAG TPA: hypothetical protein VF192_00245 [Longimicrobiales bacterium]